MSEAEQIETIENQILELKQENKRLHETIDYLTRKFLDRRLEKIWVLTLNQMSLFDEPEKLYRHPSKRQILFGLVRREGCA
ncbi:hypothetical protein Clo1100_0604 [Clostridium sp. BNL1100]|nr:hypothetical protein Clo1100_0604 [Clostridium sp. BNL1100]